MNTSHDGQLEQRSQDLAPVPSAPPRRVKRTTATPDAAAVANPDLAGTAIQARARRRARARLNRSLSQILGRRHLSSRAAFAMLTHEAAHVGPGSPFTRERP